VIGALRQSGANSTTAAEKKSESTQRGLALFFSDGGTPKINV